jgi:UDP:flavonoid glycosyltransferase YjiC (YdhE family)
LRLARFAADVMAIQSAEVRTMAHIVFFILPEMGHINSTFKIARGLRSRGHQVWYAQIADLEEHIRGQGFEFFPVFERLFPKGFMDRKHRQDLEAVILDRAASGGLDLQAFGDEIRQLIVRTRPDLLMLDFLLPNIQLIVEGIKQTGIPHLLFRNILSVTEDFAQFEARHRLLVPCPSEFDFPHTRRPATHHYVEASIDLDRRQGEFPWDEIAGGQPLVYCSLGTQSHLFEMSKRFCQTVIDAMTAKPDWRMILATGNHLRSDDFHSVPPNVRLCSVAPQLEVLRRASLVITHGGLNTVKESIFFGVPMLVFPLGRDQYLNAARVEYHHLGMTGNIQSVSVEEVSSLMEKVSHDPLIKTSMTVMSRLFREREAAGQSIKVIESMLLNSHLPPGRQQLVPAS